MSKQQTTVEDNSPRDSNAGSAVESAEHPLPEDVIRPPPEATMSHPIRMDGMSPIEGRRSYVGYATPDRGRAKTPPHYYSQEYGSRSHTGTPTWHNPQAGGRLSRSYSVASNGSEGTVESKFSDGPLPEDTEALQVKVREQRMSMDHLRVELYAKKEEVASMRTKLLQMSHELNAVSTSKGVLNEACATSMKDVWALQNRITQLQNEKEQLERTNDSLRRESLEYDRERRGLLNLLDDGKAEASKYEELYNEECKQRMEDEIGRAALMERVSLDLKQVRGELHNKAVKLKKLARTNNRLAQKLLAVHNKNSEAQNIAKCLQQQNQQLDTDNQQLSSCVLQLEQQIEQLNADKVDVETTVKEMRQDHAERLADERATLTTQIDTIEKELKTLAIAKRKEGNKDRGIAAQREEQMTLLKQEKSNLEQRVSTLTGKIDELEKEQMAAEEAMAFLRKEYIDKLELETQSLREKILEHERAIEEYRLRESDYATSQEQMKSEVDKVHVERKQTQSKVEELENLVAKVKKEKEKETEGIRKTKEKEVRRILQEKEELDQRVKSLANNLTDLEDQKAQSSEVVRKLKQDIRETEQAKETLNHQVNALEWHMQGLFREKQEAVRDLEDKNLELLRLQQDLNDKNEDLDRMMEEVMNHEETEVRIRELEISQLNVAELQDDADKQTTQLEKEIEKLRKEKAQMAAQLDKVEEIKRKRPWLNLNFKIHC